MSKVTIPNRVSVLGFAAFPVCARLTKVSIPRSITAIGEGVFRDCSQLTNVTFLGDAPYIPPLLHSSNTTLRLSVHRRHDESLLLLRHERLGLNLCGLPTVMLQRPQIAHDTGIHFGSFGFTLTAVDRQLSGKPARGPLATRLANTLVPFIGRVCRPGLVGLFRPLLPGERGSSVRLIPA